MKIIIDNLQYKKIVETMRAWQKNNKLALASTFLLFEIFYYFIIFSVITFNESLFSHVINIQSANYIWLFTTQILLVYLWIVIVASKKKEDEEHRYLEYIVVLLYLPYITYIFYHVGITSIFTGVTLVTTALVGVELIRNKLVWLSFLFHVLLISVAAFIPFYFPSIVTLDAVESVAGQTSDIAHNLFWTKFYIFLSMPKAVLGVFICMHLYSDMRKQLKQAQYSASYDELTKVKNRRFIMNYLFNIAYNKNNASINSRNPQDISVMIIDLDYFKVINDTYGHLAGDMVLIEIGKRLKHEMIKPSWQASRYGGEEFLIVLPEVSHKVAMKVAKNIHDAIKSETIKVVDDEDINVTASMGVATLSHEEVTSMRDYYKQNLDKSKKSKSVIKTINGQSTEVKSSNYEELIIERLISTADESLYDAKRNGRDQIKSAHHYVDETVARECRERNIIAADEILNNIEFASE